MNKKNLDIAAAARPKDRSPLRASVATAIVAGLLTLAVLPAHAQRVVSIGGLKRTATVGVNIGKTEDVRTDASFVDLQVGDPEVADVNPLTDKSLSILGRKSGTTRVTAYGENKKLIGVFDVEVSHDTSMLASTLSKRFPYAKLKVTSVNGRIMLSGSSPDAVTLDKAVTIAKQFGPDVINSVQVLQPQQVMLEVRFIEANRQAGRELGVQWNSFSNSGRFLANVGNTTAHERLPITPAGPNLFKNPGVTSGGANDANVLRSAIVSAGVLSGTAPFGFLVGRLIAGGLSADMLVNALEEKGMARSLAEPNLVALSGDTASFLAGGEFPIPVPGSLGSVGIEYKRYGVGLAFTPTVLSDGLINLKIEPEVSQLDTSHPVVVADVALALGQARVWPEHDVLAVVERVPAGLADVVVAHVVLADMSGEQVAAWGHHGRRVQSFGFAAPGGISPFTSASTWRTVSNAWLSLAGGVRPPIWGVATTLASRASSGDGIWSGARPTSMAAPAMRFSVRTLSRAASSTRLPRDMLMKKASGFMRAKAASFIRFSVSALAIARQIT